MAAVYNKKRLFLIALPMGFVDFLVPFVMPDNLIFMEVLVFALSVLSVTVAWYATMHVVMASKRELQESDKTEKT